MFREKFFGFFGVSFLVFFPSECSLFAAARFSFFSSAKEALPFDRSFERWEKQGEKEDVKEISEDRAKTRKKRGGKKLKTKTHLIITGASEKNKMWCDISTQLGLTVPL